jgi:hypothetical protein
MDAQTTPSPVKRSRGRPHGSKARTVFERFGAKRNLVDLSKSSGPGRFLAKMTRDIQSDLGGRRELTRIQTEMINAFAGAATVLRYLTSQVALGEISELDLTAYSNLASTMLRVGSRLGFSRHARDVTPDLDQYLHMKERARAAQEQETTTEALE